MEQHLLEMIGISKQFGRAYALRDVSIHLNQGEILAIIGENGAGKSTLMKVLSGSYAANEYTGEIRIDGESKKFNAPSDAAAAGIEMIYQEISMHLDLSVAENIFLGRMPKRNGMIDWPMLYRDAQRYMDMVGLPASPREAVRYLSTSQQQMVAIARALSRKPRVLVLDEPTSALTESEVELLFANLDKLREQGISCIYITHKMKEVVRLADRIVVLRDGRCVGVHARGETSMNALVEEMVNRKIDNIYPKVSVAPGKETLRVEHLSVPHPYSRNKKIVDDVSFSVREGEILGIVGLVGAGRSETVNAIVGSIRPSAGKVFLDGREIGIRTPKYAIRHGIILLSEDRKKNGFVPTMSVEQNITLASLEKIARGSVLQPKTEAAYAKRHVDELDIRVHSEKESIVNLSGGNQQKVVLAKWLMTEPRVLLLDEPTRGIDVGAKNQIYQIMQRIVEQGKSIVMISSELPELLGMSDRFIVLSEGKLVAEIDRGEASEELFLKLATGSTPSVSQGA